MTPAVGQDIVIIGRRYTIHNVNSNGVFWKTPALQNWRNPERLVWDPLKKAWFADVKDFQHWEVGDRVRLIGKTDPLVVCWTSAEQQTVTVVTASPTGISTDEFPMEIFELC